MERLTGRYETGVVYVPQGMMPDALERLAAYEDIDLTPEEIVATLMNYISFLCEMTGGRMSKTNYTVEAMVSAANDHFQSICDECREDKHATELLDAEADGRLVVLPCKVGDTVYKLCTVSAFLKKGDLWSGRIIERDCDMCGYGACDCHDIGPCKDGSGKNIVHESTVKSVGAIVRIMPYWGKFYFLTREEAEAALKGEGNG